MFNHRNECRINLKRHFSILLVICVVAETKSLTKAHIGNIYVGSEHQDAGYYFEDMQVGAQVSWADMKQGRWMLIGTWLFVVVVPGCYHLEEYAYS